MELGVILSVYVAHLRHVLLNPVLRESDASPVRVFQLLHIVGGRGLLRERSGNFLGWRFLQLGGLRVESCDRERFYKSTLKFEV